MSKKGYLTIPDLGNSLNNVRDFADAVAEIKRVTNAFGGQPIDVPRTFYGALYEMVQERSLEYPRDETGRVLPIQKGRVLRIPDGNVAYLYIPDADNADKNVSDRNKVHMFWCGTLTQKLNDQSDDRYRGTTENSGLFCMDNGARVELNVCAKCIKYADESVYGGVSSFNFRKFSADYGVYELYEMCPRDIDDDTPRTWTCFECGAETGNVEEVHNSHGRILCNKCYKQLGYFIDLCYVNTLDELAAWIAGGGDVNARDRDGMTPLLYMAHHNPKADIIVALVTRYGADAFATDNNGTNLLMHAVDDNDLHCGKDHKRMIPIIDAIIKDLGVGVKGYLDKKGRTAIGYVRHDLVIKARLENEFVVAGGHVRR